MAYIKTVWEDEVLDGAERFEILKDAGGAVDAFGDLAECQIQLETTVTSAGTPLSASNLNNIENGIEDISTGIARSVKGVAANAAGDVADIQASADGQVLMQDGTSLVFGQVKTAGLEDEAVTPAKSSFLSGVPNAQLFAGKITGTGSGVTVTSPMSWTATRQGEGYYRITHNLGTINYSVSPTPAETGLSVDYVENFANYFDLHITGGDGALHFTMMVFDA